MAGVIDDTESGFAALSAVAIVALAVLLYMAWRNISLPSGAYPYSIWGSISSFIDGLFAASPLAGGSIQQSTDHTLGGVSYWLLQNTPNPAKSASWNPGQYVDTYPASVDAGLGGQ